MDKIIDSFRGDHPELVNCKIKGSVPAWLKGTLYRNGPGKYRFGCDEGVHLFDGMAVLHQYIIKDGHVSYRNKLLDSDTYKRNKAANRIVVTEFGVVGHPDPCKSLFTRYFSYFLDSAELTDNDCVNFMLLGDQLYVLTETPVMNRIDPVTLDRVQKDDWRNFVAVHMATAHPMRESDGTTYNMGTHVAPHTSYKIIKIPPARPGDNNPVRSAFIVGSIPAQWPLMPNYFHSFGMTHNYIIFVEQPMAFNFLEIGTGRVTGKSVLDSLHFYEGYKTKFHILHKFTGSVVQYNYVAKPFFVFHHINAYEEDHQIVVDLCAYNDVGVVKYLTLDNIRQNKPVPQPTYRRYVLPLHVSKHNVNLVTLDHTKATATALDDGTVYCVPECIPDANIELPRIHYDKYNGKKYRYAYGVCTDRNNINKLVKLDVVNKTQTVWTEDSYYPGEPVFVADPEGSEEDDGVVLSPVIRLKDDLQSFLLVLDAKTFTEIARAWVPADINIPLSFHGIFADIQDK